MFLWWPSTRIVQTIMIGQKHGRQGMWHIFLCYIYMDNFKNLQDRFQYNISETFLFVTQSAKIVQDNDDLLKKNMARGSMGLNFPIYIYIQGLGLSFPIYIYIQGMGLNFPIYLPGIWNFPIYLCRIKTLKIFLSEPDQFQKCSFGDPLPKLFKPSWFAKKHGCHGARIIFPIYPLVQ